MKISLTQAGVNLLNSNQGPVTVTSFQVGAGFGYTPSLSDTALHGALLFTGQPTAPVAVNANVVKYSAYLDFNLGPFAFGEVGLFVGNTLFALAAADELIQKLATGSTPGNSVRIDMYLSMVGQNYAMWLNLATSNNEFQMAILPSVDNLPPSSQAVPNAYVVSGNAQSSAFMAYTDQNGFWNFDAYAYFNQASVVITGATATSITIGLGSYLPGFTPSYPGSVLLEFSSGQNYSICRQVTSTVISGSNVTISFSTPLMVLPAAGDSVTFFGRQQLSTTIPNLPIATSTTLGAVIVGTSLTVDATGLINVAPTAYPVSSVNGKTGAVVLTATDISGFATVARTGLYSDLIGAPGAYTLPVATTTTLGGVKVPTTGNLSVDGTGNLSLGFNPVKSVNTNLPDANGNVTINIPTPPPQVVYIGLVQPAAIASGQDFNQMQTTGLFYATDAVASSLINAPITTTGGTLDIEPFSTTASGGDVIQRYTTQDTIYWRRYVQSSNTWTSWVGTITSAGAIPVATSTVLGGIKVGANLTVTGDGTLSATPYSLPTASSTVLGGIKVGSGLSIDGSGVLSASSSLTAPNIMYNGSGEFGATGWTVPANFAFVRDPSYGPLFQNTSALTTASFTLSTPKVTVDPNVSHYASVDLTVGLSAGNVTLNLISYDGSNNPTTVATQTFTAASVFSRQFVGGFLPSNAVTAAVTIVGAGVSANIAGIQVRRVKLEAASSPSAYSVEADVVPATTTALGLVKVGANLAVAADGTLSATAQPLSPATTTTLGGVQIPVASSLSVDGAGNLSFVQNANMLSNSSGGSGTLGWNIPASFSVVNSYGPIFISNTTLSGVSTGIITPKAPALASTTYTLSGDIYNVSTAGTIQLAIVAYDSGGTMIGSGAFASSSNAPNGGWSRISVTGTTPAGTAFLAADVFLSGVSAPVSGVAFRRLKLELGSTPTAYSVEGDILTATTTMTGLVKGGGTNITIAADGTLNVPTGAGYSLPVATASVLGGVKPSTGLAVDGTGVLTLAPGGTTAQWVLGNGTVSNTLSGTATINGTINVGTDSAISMNGASNSILQLKTTSYNRLMYLENGAGNIIFAVSNGSFGATSTLMTISGTGMVSATDFTATSDRNAKTDIQPLVGARALVLGMQGMSFTMKASGKKSVGFIAQDFQPHQYLKDLVHTNEDGTLSLSYGPVSAVLVEAFKEQDEELQMLKLRIKQLEALVDNLVGDSK
ncbi:hypothetical protein [Ralstonia phage phiRSL1]|uniref:Peptidase S74 domain-containing protein n=1 Tax=Ralstonia phage phiRSL1 TaxID=1980924 RepID=B2ZY51_9CAUD|nr:long tail fiber protein distal subunit [Ralstonia phage phiRSL1]BAG41619.2 hypothetical protein [Ralstonia phage phiRSL1]